MATHSGVLAWRIPGMAEPGGLLSMGLHRVGHDGSDLAAAAAAVSNKKDFPGSSDGQVSAYNAGDPGSIPGSGRSSGGGNGNPLQYSCLGNPMGQGAWWATVRGVTERQDTADPPSTHNSQWSQPGEAPPEPKPARPHS